MGPPPAAAGAGGAAAAGAATGAETGAATGAAMGAAEGAGPLLTCCCGGAACCAGAAGAWLPPVPEGRRLTLTCSVSSLLFDRKQHQRLEGRGEDKDERWSVCATAENEVCLCLPVNTPQLSLPC